MKGIILAGGSGARLYPITKGVCKQLLPIYDKPMIYYPLSVLMLAGIKEVLIISTTKDIDRFRDMFGNGSELGMQFKYIVQTSPDGLAQAFILGEDFIGNSDVCLVLGDNIFYGDGFVSLLKQSVKTVKQEKKVVVFGYRVKNPSQLGVVEFDKNNNAISIEEKPANPKSNYAVVGLYFYPNSVIEIAKNVKVSDRGELEITSVNSEYLEQKNLKVELFGRGFAWLDTGTYESLLDAGHFVQTIEKRLGNKIACIEEIAYKNGWINADELTAIAKPLLKSGYGDYLMAIINE